MKGKNSLKEQFFSILMLIFDNPSALQILRYPSIALISFPSFAFHLISIYFFFAFSFSRKIAFLWKKGRFPFSAVHSAKKKTFSLKKIVKYRIIRIFNRFSSILLIENFPLICAENFEKKFHAKLLAICERRP